MIGPLLLWQRFFHLDGLSPTKLGGVSFRAVGVIWQRRASATSGRHRRFEESMPKFRHKTILVDAVQWHDDNQTWNVVRELHADSELVAFRNPDGTVSIETADGRKDAEEEGVWIVQAP
jgi:hypothetical protein